MPYRIIMTAKLRVAIIGCEPRDQEPMSYRGARMTIRELNAARIGEWAQRKGLEVEPAIYWPAGGEELPPRGSFDAAVIPGSKLNIDEAGRRVNPWMERLLDWIREMEMHGTPLLGICFGHQALGVAHGASLDRVTVPLPGEIGFAPVRLTHEGERDGIFSGMPAEFDGLFYHYWEVKDLPSGTILLAYGRDTMGIQAFRMGNAAWGVQFHPDYSVRNVQELVESRQQALRERGIDPNQLRMETGTRHDQRVLDNFLDLVARNF